MVKRREQSYTFTFAMVHYFICHLSSPADVWIALIFTFLWCISFFPHLQTPISAIFKHNIWELSYAVHDLKTPKMMIILPLGLCHNPWAGCTSALSLISKYLVLKYLVKHQSSYFFCSSHAELHSSAHRHMSNNISWINQSLYRNIVALGLTDFPVLGLLTRQSDYYKKYMLKLKTE